VTADLPKWQAPLLRWVMIEQLALSLFSIISKSLALRSAITESLALSLLRSAIIELLVLLSTVTEPFALLLLTVAEQSFAVSNLRACLLLPNDAVFALLSLPGTASEPILSVCQTGMMQDRYHRAAAYAYCIIVLPRSDVVEVRELIT